MPVRAVTIRGESSSRHEARRLRLERLPGDRVRVRIHNPEDTSGVAFDLPRAALDRLTGPGPVSAANVPVEGTTTVVQTAVRKDLHVYLWARTPGGDGWDVLVMQSTFARKLVELARS